MGDEPLPGTQMQEMLDAMEDGSNLDQYRAAFAAVGDTIASLRYLLGWVEQTPPASILASGIGVFSISTWLDQISRVA